MRLATLAWRGLSTRRLRSSLTIIGVALGVALVAGTLLANQAASEAVERSAQEILGKAALRVRAFDPAGFSPRAVDQLRRISPAVNAAAPVAERRLLVPRCRPDEGIFNLLVLGVDPVDEAAVRTYDLEAGRFISSGSADAVVNAAWRPPTAQRRGRPVLSGRKDGVPPVRIVGLLGDLGIRALQQGNVMVLDRTFLSKRSTSLRPWPTSTWWSLKGARRTSRTRLTDMTEPFWSTRWR